MHWKNSVLEVVLRSQPQWIQRFIQMALVGLVALSGFYGVLQPLKDAYEQQEHGLQQLAEQSMQQAWLWSLQQQFLAMGNEAQHIAALFPSSFEEAEFITRLLAPLSDSGSQLQHWEKLPVISHDMWQQQPWRLEIQGSYVSLCRFLHELAQQSVLLSVEQAEFMRTDNGVILKIQLNSYQLNN